MMPILVRMFCRETVSLGTESVYVVVEGVSGSQR